MYVSQGFQTVIWGGGGEGEGCGLTSAHEGYDEMSVAEGEGKRERKGTTTIKKRIIRRVD